MHGVGWEDLLLLGSGRNRRWRRLLVLMRVEMLYRMRSTIVVVTLMMMMAVVSVGVGGMLVKMRRMLMDLLLMMVGMSGQDGRS